MPDIRVRRHNRVVACRLGLLVVGLLALPLFLMFAPQPSVAETASRVEVPIFQRRLSDGTLRYWVPVRLGNGGPIEAMLDTGSFGLRILASAVSAEQYEATDIMRRYAFGSGVELRGFLARANVAVGGAATSQPVAVQIVQAVDCVAGRPHCPASKVTAENYGIGGDGLPGEGFKAILGISVRSPRMDLAALNPLSFMGSRRWTVTLPLPGIDAPGKLVINPDTEDVAGFRMIPMSHRVQGDGLSAPVDGTIPVCPDDPDAPPESCAPLKLDSGAADGLHPFHLFSVLFDQTHELFGVKPRGDVLQQ